MSDATLVRGRDDNYMTAAAAVAAGECWQLKDGRAAVKTGLNAAASGDRVNFTTTGKFVMTKATGWVGLPGNRAYWDHSANNVTYKKVNDRDFYLGRIVDDAASADTEITVDINVDPPYDLDVARDPCLSVAVGTAAAGGFGYPVRRGGCFVLELTATNEAQKIDLMSRDGFSVDANAIVEAAFLIESDGSNATQDFTIGAASGTHATDFQSVAEFVAVSTVGNSTNLNVQSDDGTTDVAPTDSTADYTEGTAVAQRVEVWIDMRDKSDVHVYINGSRVLAATTFTLAAATGPLFLVAHLEKTSSTDVYKVAVEWLRARLSEQNEA